MLLKSEGRPKNSRPQLLSLLVFLPVLLGLVFMIRMPLVWTDQAIFSGLIIAACILVGRLSTSRLTTSVLMVVSIFCTLRYIVWRWSSSVSYLNHQGWNVDRVSLAFALTLLCAESYAVLILLLGYFQSARPLKRRPVPLPADLDSWPSVDVFIPTYNESLEVVRPTVLAAMGIDWPQDRIHVYLLDDGRRPQFQEFAAECGVGYLTRFDNAHAKAGNINSAIKNTHSEYIAIFDCDHVATRSFLQVTMGWFFKDKRLAMVQTPHHFYSPDPFERNLNVFRKIPNEGALFYGVVQDGNDLWDATFFCGSCAVIKREALQQIGGIAVETVTEDAHTALRLQRLGWNTAYIGIPQAAGLATGSLAAHVGQRIRWARGMVQILRTDCPLFGRGLSLAQRLCYFNCVVHYLYAIPRLIFVSSPLVYLLFGKSNVYGMMWEIVAYAAPHLVLSNMVNSRSQGDHRHSLWNEVYEMVLAPYILLPTTFALINPKWGKFNVTAKSSVVEESFFDWKIARPYLFLLGVNLLAIIISIPRYFTGADSSGVLAINIVWAIFNSLMLGVTVAVSFESQQRRATVRVEADLIATLTLASGDVQHCRVIDLSEGGIALRSDRVITAAEAEPGSVAIHAGGQEFRFDVETVRTSDNRIHMRFLRSDLAHQRAITQIVYARADSWLDWTKDQRRDRIFSSLVSVAGIGAAGIWMLPSLLIKREKKVAKAETNSAVAKAALPGLLLCLLALPLFQTHAQISAPEPASNKPAAPSPSSPEANFRDHQSFADLGRRSALTLRAPEKNAAFSFSVAGTKIVDTAELGLRYALSDGFQANSSELVVTLNDVEVTRLPLAETSVGTTTVSHVALPADLLVHENTLRFELVDKCAQPCRHRASESLRIETASELNTSGLILPLANRLSMLPAPFFDPSVRHAVNVPIVFESQPDLPSLKAAGVVASWYGAMAGYRGSHFTVSVGQLPKGNSILFASSNGPLAAALGLAGSGEQVAICDNPADHYSKVLAIVAHRSSDLVRVARLVAGNRFHGETDRVAISAEQLAERATITTSPSWLDSSRPLPVARNLGENLSHARIDSPTKLYFRISPDLDYGTVTSVPLHLAFRLSGLIGDDHVWVSIRLNNTSVARRRLGRSDCGEARQSYAIPVSLLYSSNTLAVELSTNRSDTVVSDPASVDLQVLPETDLDLGNPAHFTRMPRLDLFAASGFPFTAKSDLSETVAVLPSDATPAQIGLFLDAFGFMAAQTGVPASNFEVQNPKTLVPGTDRNLLVIASSNDENTFRRFERSMIIIPSGGKFELGESSLPWQEWFSRSWLGRKEETEKLSTVMGSDGGPKFLLEQFASPFRSNRSVLLIATRSETDDRSYFDRLAEASRDGAVSGGVTVADDNRFVSFDLNSGSYSLGNNVSLPAVYSWLKFHLWILPLFLIAFAVLLARRWEALLAHQVESRLNSEV